MLPDTFAIIGAVIGSLGGFYYVFETMAGRAQPNRITWLLWGIFPMVIFVAQRVQGVPGVSWASFAAGLTPLLVVAASFFNRNAYWKTEPRDYGLMAAAILGILLWGITRNPNLALLFSLLADMLASVPTLLKARRHPRSESWVAYAISATGFGISLLSVQTFNFQSAAFVAYVFLLNAALAMLASMRASSGTPTPGPGGAHDNA
ncbi:hypothetical protein [Geothrix sp. 21YS21S-2]|uniref:hypothetical protein n=1 Tax=Geothrix sp. 21YS21S-2 TaxID=3068893 RepID=UPI0027BA9B72|nr:hypothetical protein [Geothrix sp. 21YS21S-2]